MIDLQEVSQTYLRLYYNDREIPGGLSYSTALQQLDMDGKMDSLRRLDALLDQIREKQRPERAAFLKELANRNFLYLLCFYLAEVIAEASGKGYKFQTRDQLIAEHPDTAGMVPEIYENTVIMMLQDPAGRVQTFFPLVPILSRLFEGAKEKSVHFSASAYL